MKKIYAIIFGSICINAKAQVSGITIDHSAGSPIPYVNIWLKGKMQGTTSDNSGNFSLPFITNSDTVVFSAAGYVSKEIIGSDELKKVLMQKSIIALRELKVRNKRSKRLEIEIGKFPSKHINQYWAAYNNPYQIGRYFAYHDSLQHVPFIKNIKMYLWSMVSGAIANVRIYEADENGCPENELHSENIFIHPRKGTRLTKVEVEDLNIEFPRSGLVVAIEFMIIPSNRYEIKVAGKDTVHVRYSPSIGVVPTGMVHNSLLFEGGQWRKITMPVFKSTASREIKSEAMKSTFTVPAIMLTVSN